MEKKTVAFDFDGVIHSYVSGWKGTTNIPDPPVPGIKEAIDELRADGYHVVVFSTRCQQPAGAFAIETYLSENGIEVDEIVAEKPIAICYIDDRAICFNGNANVIPEKVRTFKTWIENDADQSLGKWEAFRMAVQPIHDWLCKYGHPHMNVYVRQDGAEASEGVCAAPLTPPD